MTAGLTAVSSQDDLGYEVANAFVTKKGHRQQNEILEFDDGMNKLMIACQQGLEYRIARLLEKKVGCEFLNFHKHLRH